MGLSEDLQSDKRRLGSALNIGRGKGTSGKRVSEEDGGEFGERFFREYEEAARGQRPFSNENKQLAGGYDGQEEVPDAESDVDRRNIGSAMNLIKVRKNNLFWISPSAVEGDDPFEEERERRRLGAAMNLKKVTERERRRLGAAMNLKKVTENRSKSRLSRD